MKIGQYDPKPMRDALVAIGMNPGWVLADGVTIDWHRDGSATLRWRGMRTLDPAQTAAFMGGLRNTYRLPRRELEGHTVVEKREHQWISEGVVGDREDHEHCAVCGRSRTVEAECEEGE